MNIFVMAEGVAKQWLGNGVHANSHGFSSLSWWDKNVINNINKINENDLAIFIGCGQVDDSLRLFMLKNTKIKKIYWFVDTVERWPNEYNAAINNCEFVFLSQKDSKFIDNKKTFWMPMAYDTSMNVEVKDITLSDKEKYGCDVLYIGTFNNKRKLTFVELLRQFDFKLYGDNWPGINYTHDGIQYYYPRISEWRGRAIYGKEFSKAVLSSEINVNIHYPHHGSEEFTKEYGPNPKVFEIMGAGGFLITDNVQGVLDLFENGKHLVIYNTFAGMVDKIRYYLANNSLIAKIAAAGKEEVIKKHTWPIRVKQAIEITKTGRNIF